MNKCTFNPILSSFGRVFKLLSLMLLIPLVSLLWYPKEYYQVIYFIVPSLICFIISLVFKFVYKDILYKQNKGQQIIVLVLTWLLTCIVLGIPFIISGNLNFTQAFFDSASGSSTTGLSVVDITHIDKIFLLYRSIIQFYGGVGIILILVTIFNNSIGFELYEAEGHSDRLYPSMRKSASLIIKIMLGYIVIGWTFLMLANMPSFDALNIAICSVATGGFGVTANSIADYNSSAIDIIIIVLMILGSLSFVTNVLICNGKFKRVFKIAEVRLFFILIIIMSIITSIFTIYDFNTTIFKHILLSVFSVVSAITGTGFSVVDYSQISSSNQTMFAIILVAMIIGGAVGSTAGGIKITRINIILTSIKLNIKRLYTPDNKLIRRVIVGPAGKKQLTSKNIIMSANYIGIYMIILVIGTLMFVIYGYSFSQSFFEFASALGNVGLTIGITSPNLAPILLWTLSIGMILGRLEILLVFVFFIKIFEQFSYIFKKRRSL